MNDQIMVGPSVSPKNPAKTKYGKVTTDELSKPDPRVFSTDDPQPDPNFLDVDPRRIGYSTAPEPHVGPLRKHTATDFDKQLEEREAERLAAENEEDFMLAPNPQDEVARQYARDGFTSGFMSDFVEKKLGRRGWVPVIDEKGDVVRMGDMKLVQKPTRIVNAYKERAQAESTERVDGMKQDYHQSVESLKGQARDMGLKVLEGSKDDMSNMRSSHQLNFGA